MLDIFKAPLFLRLFVFGFPLVYAGVVAGGVYLDWSYLTLFVPLAIMVPCMVAAYVYDRCWRTPRALKAQAALIAMWRKGEIEEGALKLYRRAQYGSGLRCAYPVVCDWIEYVLEVPSTAEKASC